MTVKRNRLCRISVLLMHFVLCCNKYPESKRQLSADDQKVFTDMGGVGHELVFDLYEGQLRIRPTRRAPEGKYGFLVDGTTYIVDRKVVDENYKNLRIENHLIIKDGALFFDGHSVVLPNGVKMRAVWQAILWNGWVICIGRTSKSDESAKLTPPFFASELIVFEREHRLVDEIRYLTFNPPPTRARLFVLRPI